MAGLLAGCAGELTVGYNDGGPSDSSTVRRSRRLFRRHLERRMELEYRGDRCHEQRHELWRRPVPAAPRPAPRCRPSSTADTSSARWRIHPWAVRSMTAGQPAGCAPRAPTSVTLRILPAIASSAGQMPTAPTPASQPMIRPGRIAISCRAFPASRTSASSAPPAPTAPAIPRANSAISTRAGRWPPSPRSASRPAATTRGPTAASTRGFGCNSEQLCNPVTGGCVYRSGTCSTDGRLSAAPFIYEGSRTTSSPAAPVLSGELSHLPQRLFRK